MTTNAMRSDITIELNLLDADVSPEQYVTLPEGSELTGFGEVTPLLDVTHYQSTSREYIGGLADGNEFTVTCNRTHDSPNYQDAVIALKGLTRGMRVTETDSSESPNTTRTYTFEVVVLGWNITPPVGDKVSISFDFKITGGITVAG